MFQAPGPPARFLTGNLPEFSSDPLRYFLEWTGRYGGVVRFRLARQVVHLVTEPAGIKHVLQTNFQNYYKGFAYDKLGPILGRGLATSNGADWQRQRSLAQPAFHRGRIESFANVMVETTHERIADWAARSQAQPLCMSDELRGLTMSVVSKTLLGSDVTDPRGAVGQALVVMLREAYRRVVTPFRVPDFIPTPGNVRFNRAVSVLDGLVRDTIRARRQERSHADDLLGMLMAAREEATAEGLSESQLIDEVKTIFFAGHETTALVLGWTLYLLSIHPEIEKRVCAELEGELGGAAATLESLGRLTYLDRVLSEATRLYPPTWVFARDARKADEIAGHPIPAGSTILISPFASHHNPRYWRNPEGFDPERFSERNAGAIVPHTFLPFGAGPRHCIGSHFALLEMKAILATVLQKYELHLAPGRRVEPEPGFSLRVKGGLFLTIHERRKTGGEYVSRAA
jgi:cytochrome P450